MGHRSLWISIDKQNRYFSGGKITASCCRGHWLSCPRPNVSEISSGCLCPAMATYDILEIAGTCFLNIKLCRDFHFWHSFIAGAAIVNLILQSNKKICYQTSTMNYNLPICIYMYCMHFIYFHNGYLAYYRCISHASTNVCFTQALVFPLCALYVWYMRRHGPH